MHYGLCCGPELAADAKAAGFDYFEPRVERLLCPTEPEAEFERRRREHDAAGLPHPVVNILFPAGLPGLVGPGCENRRDLLRRHLDIVFDRAVRGDIETIVFGSSAARSLPEDFPREEGWQQLVAWGRELGDRAAAAGLRIAVEPLNRRECNMFTSLAETLTFVAMVDRPAVAALVDAYHWARENEAVETIARAGDRLIHAHVATAVNRQAPGEEPCDLSGFYRGLVRAGYDGRMSVEGGLPEPERLPRVLAAMRDGMAAAAASERV